ncbi:hypothetical protein AX17_003163 [Amanita inopinata Kibby_2008]|nr:hypothetical protein AX17_003163 [Amanita inopinata Kibby_2008]
MKIEIVVDPTKSTSAPSLVSRVAPAASGATVVRMGVRGRRGRGGRVRKGERPVKSAADLDAEMEDYTINNGPTTAPAAAAAV